MQKCTVNIADKGSGMYSCIDDSNVMCYYENEISKDCIVIVNIYCIGAIFSESRTELMTAFGRWFLQYIWCNFCLE